MAFPTTSLLDALTSGALSANWTTPTWGKPGTITITVGTGAGSSVTAAAAYWNPTTFTDTEAYGTIAATDVCCIGVRMTNNGTTSAPNLNGYQVQMNGSGFFALRKYVNNVASNLASMGSPPTMGVGDMIGISAIGTTIKAYYKASGGSWVEELSATDATYASGNIGFWFNTTAGKMKDFSGGDIPVVPANTVAPVASGTATVGQTLSATTGTWTGTPTPTYTYQWQRDTAGNLSFSNIGSATASTYVLVDADDGNKVRCVVTGTNTAGSATGNSNALGLVIEPVPTISVAPAVTGLTTLGSTLSCTTGTWTHQGGSIATYAYQWQRDTLGDTVYANIAAATSSTYVLAAADNGCNVRCVVTATNSGGAGTAANSNAVLDTTSATTAGGVQDDADIVFLFDL
jgi:hypothetical protein